MLRNAVFCLSAVLAVCCQQFAAAEQRSAAGCMMAPTKTCVIDLAYGLLKRMPPGTEKTSAMADMALALADGGNHVAAEQILAWLPPAAQDLVKQRIVKSLVKTGRVGLAVQKTAEIGDNKSRVLALTYIAGAADIDKAPALLDSAHGFVAGILGVDSHTSALSAIAQAEAILGHASRAVQTVSGIQDPLQRSMALAKLSERLTASQPDVSRRILAQAEALALSLAYADGRVYPMEAIAEAYALLGDLPAANKVLNLIANRYSRDRARGNMAKTLAGQRKFDAAFSVIGPVFHNDLRGAALAEIARYQAMEGMISQALATVAAIPPQADSDNPLSRIAVLQSGQGDVRGALATAARVRDAAKRDVALVEIAIQFEKTGSSRQAVRVIESMQTPTQQVAAFVRMAHARGFKIEFIRNAISTAGRISTAHERIVGLAQIAIALPE